MYNSEITETDLAMFEKLHVKAAFGKAPCIFNNWFLNNVTSTEHFQKIWGNTNVLLTICQLSRCLYTSQRKTI